MLWKTAMPSILIELGFISNAAEERFLASEDGQTYMASAIYRAFRDFKASFEGENQTVKDQQGSMDTTPAVTPEPQPIPESKPVVEAPKEQPAEKPAEKPADKTQVSFKVQIATRDIEIPLTDHAFAKVKDVGVYYYNGAYRYTSGDFRTKQEAINRQAEVRKLGFSDAFVVAFINGERATIKEAENALKKE